MVFARCDPDSLAHPVFHCRKSDEPRQTFASAWCPAGATLSIALAAGLMRPGSAWAAPVNQAARPRWADKEWACFRPAQRPAPQSREIKDHGPDIAETAPTSFWNVPPLPEVDGFVVFVERNLQQLVAAFWITPRSCPN